MKRRTFLASGSALLLSACATPFLGNVNATEVPAPRWRAGDNWTFRRTDGFNGLPRGVLTRTVESVEQDVVRFVTRNETGIVLDEALFAFPGAEVSGTLTEYGPAWGTFTPPLRMYDFPLISGKEWRQSVVRTDAGGFRSFVDASIRTEGWEEGRAGDKTYQALVIRRNLVLGPTDPFFGILHREELEWYVPELRGAMKMRISEYISSRSMLHLLPGDRFHYALESFRLA
ncbi:MAG: hypothetical protein WBM28_06930 [Burkholderiales bacterium]